MTLLIILEHRNLSIFIVLHFNFPGDCVCKLKSEAPYEISFCNVVQVHLSSYVEHCAKNKATHACVVDKNLAKVKWRLFTELGTFGMFNLFNNQKWFFAFFSKLIWPGVGFFNKTGAEIGY